WLCGRTGKGNSAGRTSGDGRTLCRSPPRGAVFQAVGEIEKNWVRFALIQLQIVPRFSSIKKTANRSVAPRSSAALVSLQLTQFWQHPSHGFSRSVRLLRRHRRRGDSERRRAFDQGNRGPWHPREVELCLRDSAGALEHDCILSVASDFADALV